MSRVVDVSYRGLRVAQRVPLAETATEQGFVELDAPLPVGTRVSLVGEGSFVVEAQVTGVVEQEAGGKATAGMRLDWRPSKAATTLEIDPETDAMPETETDAMPETDEAPAATTDEAGTSSPPIGDPEGGGRGRRRRKKTQIGRA